ncbi:cupin domain-containing protein [Anaerostipes hadrus]|nr:cupin domain-containing protein [Anaerostipes hadrus]
MRTKQRNNLAETARHERVAQNTDVYAVKARNYKGLRRGSPVLCRNNWHIHHAKNGGGQIIICVAGRGYYQEEGKEAIEMKPGDCINIPPEVKHWHGAAKDSWFSHLAVEVPGEETSNEWCEAVSDEEYGKLK